MELILASGSPRRQELLKLVAESFVVCTVPVSERVDDAVPPREAALLLARRKAQAVAALRPADLVVGSDTVVDLDGRILGKPHDPGRARSMLEALSGRSHWVHTAVCLCRGDSIWEDVSSTEVRFAPLTAEEMDWYVSTGEGLDKAGGYGIQGYGARFISGITEDYHTVMSLPVRLTYQLLRAASTK